MGPSQPSDGPRRLPLVATGAVGAASPGPPLLPGEASAEELVIAYHERTKHHYHAFSAALGYLDWAAQPDPFRRFAGARLVHLPRPEVSPMPGFAELDQAGGVLPEPLSLASLSRFFRASLSVTAWKRLGDTTWPLRANPSSGNLHPSEGYAILPAGEGFHSGPAAYHYAPREHALELRAELGPMALPEGTFVVGLSSIHWREAWKYGERAFRYCQHDVGHALAGLRIAAALLGWRLTLLSGVGDASIARLLGLDRDADFAGAEREQPDLLAVVGSVLPDLEVFARSLRGIDVLATHGQANRLSRAPSVEWSAIEEVSQATRRADHDPIREDFARFATAPATPAPARSAEAIILGRRSAVGMDATTTLPAATFFRMLARLLPDRERRVVPWDALPFTPRIHLGLFVHRVDGLAAGLYALVRDPAQLGNLRAALRPGFLWQEPPGCPAGLPLYLLAAGDGRSLARQLSCGQDIAADGAFSLAMLADYLGSVVSHGAAFYRNLFWEAGMLGQVLYLEAEQAGVRGTGIGCYFDDPVHEAFGLTSAEWQSFYHFSVGGAVEDTRLTSLPAYGPWAHAPTT